METADITKTKIHFGRIDRMSWDKTGLKAYINECLKNNENVDNWSDLARLFNVTDKNGEFSKNGGQIIKGFLNEEGIDISGITKKRKNGNTIIRRSKNRLYAGKEISGPVDCTNKEVRQRLKRKIEDGEYSIGEEIPGKKVCYCETCGFS